MNRRSFLRATAALGLLFVTGWRAQGQAPTAIAKFSTPHGVAVDGAGNLYVADTLNATIRKITPDGTVSTLAGTAKSRGSADGLGGAAQFAGPTSVAVDSAGNLYVADTSNQTIRKITPDGMVSTLAGSAKKSGNADGPGVEARFSQPSGVAVDRGGNVYVADQLNHTIRKITSEGIVSTLAGSAKKPGVADGPVSVAQFHGPTGVALDGAGNVYVTDTDNFTIRKITPAGMVSTLAGRVGSAGVEDGLPGKARFAKPRGLAVDGSGNVYVADEGNSAVRKITSAGVVSTLVGAGGTVIMSAEAVSQAEAAAKARIAAQRNAIKQGKDYHKAEQEEQENYKLNHLKEPAGVAVDASGNVFVADTGNYAIRKITGKFPAAGVLSTVAGHWNGYGDTDGPARSAK